ncbi:putative disease resistance protein RGA4 [Vitis riparia]|uniref:putative disease resistance protein RGA4 n=1 Tax=Vitis riparia TaxID=96939 RepID=UPI00155AB4F5|nr:putative disease resistance protein RGA4 [Vitis riparia]XP_034678577.1 putative disease resistance protein RGA4 [Vitis riparia]XP_034678578.1 putative disease resistance protein RGA4 [Vitis riparia]XP_034678580.1 putative disease resistance protein RGA4 [Vitis riparia]XP_034678581.1 putative disease resistance protein RGA4 [Vitis riparia]XP_034678582.1 putative disease resistance protein RGA4 [Vitis riparia]XP_034678583.1 putative disease resistance protein RGA4 [Vitis riparia]XP_03467858
MAAQIPFSIIDGILTKLASLTREERSIYDVPEELSDRLTIVKNVLLDADKKQVCDVVVKAWVRRLKDVVYDADDLLDDFATHQPQRGGVASQVCDFFSSSNQLVFRFKMSNRLRNIKEEVDKIENLINPLALVQGNTVHSIGNRAPPSTNLVDDPPVVVGRDEDKEEIIKLLVSSGNEKNLSVVAIVGIGGLGKTTLARLVYDDEKVVRHFEFRLWVHVPVGFDVRSLVKKILHEVSSEHVEGLDLFDLKDKLHEELNRRRYLLVLDDVWEVPIDRWEELRSLLIVGNEGSKILVTTRNRQVAEHMGDHSPFDLKRIKEDESLNLFLKMAFEEGEEKKYPNLINIGKEIVEWCAGVPLIIKSLGVMLYSRIQESEWLSFLENDIFPIFKPGILPALLLSYIHLPTCLKECFTYCALFPEDYEIEKKSLIQLWMAQGYIQSLNDNNEQLEDIGGEYFDVLVSRSFFMVERHAYNNKEYYKMHKLIHELAQTIIASDVPTPTHDRFEIQKPLVNPLINASQKISLRTFFMVNEDGFEDDSKVNSIINTVNSSSKCLRVLSLNKFNIKRVPKFVGKFSHLRYLDLSNNDFKVLPSSIARLKHLQTLKVIDCVNLKELPKDTRELVHLRHLENDGCANLTHMPCGIGELASLQSLPIFVVGNRRGYSRDRKIGGLNELEKLDYLRGELRIKNLENVWNAKESTDANLAAKKYISSLRLEWRDPEANNERCEAAESVMEKLRPHDHLEKLWIDGYKGEKFPNWMDGYNDGLFSKLVHIVLFSCERCQILPPFAQLPVLKFMWLSGLEEVEYVTDCSSATPPFFPSLQMLKLDNLPKLKGLRKKGSSSEEDPSFPFLSKLDVGFCHKLTSLTLHSSPSLSEASLTLHHCLNLKSLTLPSSPCLLELSITCCKLESLELPSSGLSKLYITECNDLKSLNLHSSPDLSQLTIRDCHNLTSLAQPPSSCLSQLEIRDCANLTSFELRHSAPELSSLEIRDCPKLTSLKVPLLPRLEKLHLNTLNKEVLQQFPFVSASRHT